MTDERERYLDDYGHRVSSAAAGSESPRRLFRRPRVLIAVTAIAIAAAIAGVAGLPGGRRIDPVARASDALFPSGSIIHMKLTTRMVADRPNTKVPGPQTVELWSAADPTRWRYVQFIPDDVRTGDAEGYFNGREELAYAGGVLRDYIARRDQVKVTTGYRDPRVPGLVPVDPQRDIRPLLQRGELRDEGEATVGGRRVHRLIGETAAADGRTARRVVYEVDAETFEPVAGELAIMVSIPERGGARAGSARDVVFKTTFDVDVYERLPDSADNAERLQIKTTPQTRVTTTEIPPQAKEFCLQNPGSC